LFHHEAHFPCAQLGLSARTPIGLHYVANLVTDAGSLAFLQLASRDVKKYVPLAVIWADKAVFSVMGPMDNLARVST
jgi:hypothetical protein